MATHRDDVALEVANEDIPSALVDDEGRLAVVPRVPVGARDDPCRRVGNTLESIIAFGDECSGKFWYRR